MTAHIAFFLKQRGFIPRRITPVLLEGRNNRVFKTDLEDGQVVLIKEYFQQSSVSKSRLVTEWDFLQYLASDPEIRVPRGIFKDEERNIACYSFVVGKKTTAFEVSDDVVCQLSDFIVEINKIAGNEKSLLSHAADAWVNLSTPIVIVERKIDALRRLSKTNPLHKKVTEFLNFELLPCWRKVKEETIQCVNSLKVSSPRLFVSPSDFGLHNTIIDNNGSLWFVDFEYAGLDDLAKLICDLFCCPEVPIDPANLDGFLEKVCTELPVDAELRNRVNAYIKLNRIRWVTIMLNRFTSTGAKKQEFLGGAQSVDDSSISLVRAKKYFHQFLLLESS